MRCLVVVPTYNEAANITQVLELLQQAGDRLTGLTVLTGHETDNPPNERPNGEQPNGREPSSNQPDGEQPSGEQPDGEQPDGEWPTNELDVLVVDDGSPDGTADLAEKWALEHARVSVLRRTTKDGLGQAYLAGFAWGLERGYDVLVEMDADLSHDPLALPSLLAKMGEADLVIGSRYVPGGEIPQWSRRRRALSRWGNRYSSAMLGLPVRDLTSGYRAYRAELLRSLPLAGVRAGGYGFQIEMAHRSIRQGARVVEVPIRFTDRTEGASKMSSWITVEALGLVTGWGLRRLAGRPRPR